jgi:hypothetical protein
MSIEYDEKGKYYTDVVTKVAVPAIIQTTDHLIRGQVHVRQGERLKDELEGQGHFLAVTSAIIQDREGQAAFKSQFLAVQKQHIIWIMPADESDNKGAGA